MLQSSKECSAVMDKKLIDHINQLKEAKLYIEQYLNNRIGIPPIQQISEPCNVHLNSREYEILFLMFLGKSNFDIARYLSKIHGDRAGRTTTGFKMLMYNKLGVHTDEELINKAMFLNLIKDIPKSFIT